MLIFCWIKLHFLFKNNSSIFDGVSQVVRMLIKAGLGDGKIKWEIENGKLLILSFYFMLKYGMQFFQDQRQHLRNGKSWWRWKKWYITTKECFKTKFYAAHQIRRGSVSADLTQHFTFLPQYQTDRTKFSAMSLGAKQCCHYGTKFCKYHTQLC